MSKNHAVLAFFTLVGVLAYVFAPDRDVVASVYLACIAGLSWLFVATYGVGSNWLATAAGRGLMRLMLCMALICTQGLITILTDYSYPGREVIRPLLLLGIGLTVLDLWLTLRRIQRRGGGEVR